MEKELRIAFLTSTDPTNKKAWSGIHFQMYNALKKIYPETYALGPIPDQIPRALLYLRNKLTHFFTGKQINKAQNLSLGIWYSFLFSIKLKQRKYDLIFAPIGSSQVAFLKTRLPIFYYGDTSFSQINGYYPEFSNLSKLSFWESNLIERKSLRKSHALIYASDWAANHVVSNYRIPREKVFVVPFGANVFQEQLPIFNEEKLKDPVCRLLFLGVDWERKGGNLAFETMLELNKRGINSELTVVGCKTPVFHPKVKVHPFLDKNNVTDYQKFRAVFSKSHFLIMPTRAECAGIVYAEASAFHVPSLATDTGGVPAMIQNGINGFRLSLFTNANEYADIIQDYFLDKDRYRTFAHSSFELYQKELNWEHWAEEIQKVFKQKIKE
ncbi:MAG: glycosyltransferase family 4 protein [Bacteroidales bacterium]|nr:glycosyltransferase family 4 protein [Bacteroidales bacterium]